MKKLAAQQGGPLDQSYVIVATIKYTCRILRVQLQSDVGTHPRAARKVCRIMAARKVCRIMVSEWLSSLGFGAGLTVVIVIELAGIGYSNSKVYVCGVFKCEKLPNHQTPAVALRTIYTPYIRTFRWGDIWAVSRAYDPSVWRGPHATPHAGG